MESEKSWLQFYWGGKAYAVPMEDVGGIIRRNRFRQDNRDASIPIKYLHEEYKEGNEKWIIILRNHAVQLRLTADRIIGEVRTEKDTSRRSGSTVGLFSIRRIESNLTGGHEEI